MNFTSFHNQSISILHFPGKQKKENAEKIWELSETHFRKPENLTIVSIMTPDLVCESPLHHQLYEVNHIPYINGCPKTHLQWINKHKPRYVLNALDIVDTEYALILDGNDVVIVDDLDKSLESYFSYERDIIYNATSNRFPDLPLDEIPFADENNARKILFGPFCYLNAGCCIGKTEALKWFYQEVNDLTKLENVPSEQYYVRKAMGLHQDRVFFDYDCRVFQAFNKGVKLEFNDGEQKDLNPDGEVAKKEE